MDIKNTISLLKSRGYRITPQRVTIIKILHKNREHPGADEIFKQASKLYPKISMATIYNVLEVLEKEGLVKAIPVNQNTRRYDPNISAHAHFICDRCNNVSDVEVDDKFTRKMQKYFSDNDYDFTSMELILRGFCKNCMKNE